MDLLVIIYIFVLFIIFSPNFIFQTSLKKPLIQSLVHGVIFSLLFYVTYPIIQYSEKEGATIGTYESQPNNIKFDIEIPNSTLGSLVLSETKDVNSVKNYKNDVVAMSNNDKKLDKLTEMSPYDYNNFRSYDYDNMKKRVSMLETHKHTNQYYNEVPNLSKKQDEVMCAANYGTNTSCCRQPHSYIPDDHVCGPLKPYCTDYIDGKQWGKCVENDPHPKPTLNIDKNVMEKIILDDGKNTDNENDSNQVIVKSCDT